MNYGRVTLAGLAGAVAYFMCGGVISGQLIAAEYKPYEAVYRSREAFSSLNEVESGKHAAETRGK
jgi:hypothetical protein